MSPVDPEDSVGKFREVVRSAQALLTYNIMCRNSTLNLSEDELQRHVDTFEQSTEAFIVATTKDPLEGGIRE